MEQLSLITTGSADAAQAQMLSEQFAARGLAKAVLTTAREQIEQEAKTRELAPDAYRLSSMPDATVQAVFRRGSDTMATDGLLQYFAEGRRRHLRTASLEENTGVDECDGGLEKKCTALAVVKKESRLAPARQMPRRVVSKIRENAPLWFDREAADTSSDRRRFPLSAMAAMLAVTVSLLLIVASSVMIRLAESDVSRLKDQIASSSSVVNDLQSDLDVQNDLLQIRAIATEEYGMIAEEYVKSDYVSLRSEDSVEVFEEERESTMGLSALLSAIGLK